MHSKRNIPEEVRKECYLRDQEQCQYPGCELSRPNGDNINLHHIQNEQFGGTEDPGNLITLCDIHHKSMHIEFHAFYPDSEGILRRMNRIVWLFVSKIRSSLGVDDAYDLQPFLFYLTKSKQFRNGQLEAIRAAMSGKDVLLVTPTGTGKSVCYQLPGMLSGSPSIVISPLKALMVDQVRSIWSRMIPATYINSDLSEGEKKRRYEFIGKKLYKFIFAAPERFFSSRDPGVGLLYTNYSYMVVDEAHSIDSWGVAFRPSYRKLGELRKKLNNPPIIALTATASRETQNVIVNSLGMSDAKVIVTGFYKENIEIVKFIAESVSGKYSYLTNLLANDTSLKTLVFVPTIKEGEWLKERMFRDGYEAEFYNGKLDTKQKMDIQSRFTSLSKPNLNLLISTSAFGMGIDIPDIRRVVHWSPALSLTEYTQQIGRAGRDGKLAKAYLLYEPRDEGLLRFLSLQETTKANFKEIHEYSDEDVEKVQVKLNKQVDDMIDLTSVESGNEWMHILDYFGETPIRFWSRNGKLIVDSLLCIMLFIILFMVSDFIIS